MQILEIRISNMHFGGNMARIAARSNQGTILLGITHITEKQDLPAEIARVVDLLESTNDHVSNADDPEPLAGKVGRSQSIKA